MKQLSKSLTANKKLHEISVDMLCVYMYSPLCHYYSSVNRLSSETWEEGKQVDHKPRDR